MPDRYAMQDIALFIVSGLAMLATALVSVVLAAWALSWALTWIAGFVPWP